MYLHLVTEHKRQGRVPTYRELLCISTEQMSMRYDHKQIFVRKIIKIILYNYR